MSTDPPLMLSVELTQTHEKLADSAVPPAPPALPDDLRDPVHVS